ncbi:MAG: hypothetical protein ATN36_00770 [Epulopiscium sp. Nele67-Bin005]|nr:MAG: hypothetical protein ATN36_00770 [Epulopiscium sp. Nele67-Bin005]
MIYMTRKNVRQDTRATTFNMTVSAWEVVQGIQEALKTEGQNITIGEIINNLILSHMENPTTSNPICQIDGEKYTAHELCEKYKETFNTNTTAFGSLLESKWQSELQEQEKRNISIIEDFYISMIEIEEEIGNEVEDRLEVLANNALFEQFDPAEIIEICQTSDAYQLSFDAPDLGEEKDLLSPLCDNKLEELRNIFKERFKNKNRQEIYSQCLEELDEDALAITLANIKNEVPKSFYDDQIPSENIRDILNGTSAFYIYKNDNKIELMPIFAEYFAKTYLTPKNMDKLNPADVAELLNPELIKDLSYQALVTTTLHMLHDNGIISLTIQDFIKAHKIIREQNN